MKPLQKIRCKINQRPQYKGRKLRKGAENLDGRIYLMQVMWLMDKDDPYPGEYALIPLLEGDKKELIYDYKMSWIASGDVEVIDDQIDEGNAFVD